ncbi:hypothetical protein BDI4_570066 [Burkholderia diffusa]|nr:hypothetical protein BDI4_570066 [Burkholderia diffusa]
MLIFPEERLVGNILGRLGLRVVQ